MREQLRRIAALLMGIAVALGLFGAAPQAQAAEYWEEVTTVEPGNEYLFYIDGIAPPTRPAGPYTIIGSDEQGRVSKIINSAAYEGTATQDDKAAWIAEEFEGGIALRSKTALDAEGNPLYINISLVEGTEYGHASLGEKQALEINEVSGKVTIGRTIDGEYWNLRYSNWAGDGWQANTDTQNGQFTVMRAATPGETTFTPRYFQMRNVVDGGQYVFYIPGIVPTDMPRASYTLFPEAKEANNGETRLAFTTYEGNFVKDEDATWVAEAMGDGFALRSLNQTDANGNPLYLNIGERETDVNLSVGLSAEPQELEIRKGMKGVRIGTTSQAIWYNIRFTNPALPGWTAGNGTASSEFFAMSWAETQEELDALREADVDPVDDSTPNERPEPNLTFAAISDMHIDYGFEDMDDPIRPANREVLAQIAEEENPDLLLTGGDFISYNGGNEPWARESWENVTGELRALLPTVAKDGRVIAVKGNHEYETSDGSFNASVWAEQVMQETLGDPLAEVREGEDKFNNQLGFHYVIDGMHFLGLNAAMPGASEYTQEGIDWIRAELNKLDRDETIFLIAHFPLLDSRGMSPGYGAKNGGEELRQTLVRYPNLIHLYGHDHGGDHAYIRKDTFERVTPYNIDGSVTHDPSVRSTGHVSSFMGSLSYYRNMHDPDQWLSEKQPSIIQALMIYVYDDRIELEMKNYGEKNGPARYLEPYVIPRVDVTEAPLTSDTWVVDEDKGVVRDIPHRTTVADFIAGFDNAEQVQVVDFDGTVVEDTSRFIRPGLQVRRVIDGEVADQRPVRVDKAADLGYEFSIGTVKLDTSEDDPMDIQSVDVTELDETEGAHLVAAMYDEDGTQLAMTTQPLDGTGSYELTFTDEIKDEADAWKVWAVDSLTTMRPVAEFASDTGERYPNKLVTNPGQPELIGVNDQRNSMYRIYPADVESFDNSEALWSFAPTEEQGWFVQAAHSNPSDIKVRYSEYYGDYVVLAVASGGYFGVIDLNTQEPLYYWAGAKNEDNPHSIDILPDGNVVVASSSGNSLTIYPASTGDLNKRPHRVEVHDAHSAHWDPQQELIYTHGSHMHGFKVTGTSEDPVLEEEFSYELPSIGGHDLDPVRGMPSKYWVTTIDHLYWFDADTRELTLAFPGHAVLERQDIKAVTNFPESGRVVTTAPNNADNTAWRTDEVFVYSPNGDSYDEQIVTSATDTYYKVRAWVHPPQ